MQRMILWSAAVVTTSQRKQFTAADLRLLVERVCPGCTWRPPVDVVFSIDSTIVFNEKLGCCVIFPTAVCNGAGEQDKMQRIHRAVRQLSEARGGRQGPNARPRSLIDRTWSSTKKSKLSQNFGTLQACNRCSLVSATSLLPPLLLRHGCTLFLLLTTNKTEVLCSPTSCKDFIISSFSRPQMILCS